MVKGERDKDTTGGAGESALREANVRDVTEALVRKRHRVVFLGFVSAPFYRACSS